MEVYILRHPPVTLLFGGEGISGQERNGAPSWERCLCIDPRADGQGCSGAVSTVRDSHDIVWNLLRAGPWDVGAGQVRV